MLRVAKLESNLHEMDFIFICATSVKNILKNFSFLELIESRFEGSGTNGELSHIFWYFDGSLFAC